MSKKIPKKSPFKKNRQQPERDTFSFCRKGAETNPQLVVYSSNSLRDKVLKVRPNIPKERITTCRKFQALKGKMRNAKNQILFSFYS
jgi:hypothetical protein